MKNQPFSNTLHYIEIIKLKIIQLITMKIKRTNDCEKNYFLIIQIKHNINTQHKHNSNIKIRIFSFVTTYIISF